MGNQKVKSLSDSDQIESLEPVAEKKKNKYAAESKVSQSDAELTQEKNLEEFKQDKNKKPKKQVNAKPPKTKKPKIGRAKTHGKKYQESHLLIDPNKIYTIDEALEVLPKTSFTKFDAGVEIHLNLNLDVKKSEQNLRLPLVLPNKIRKEKIIAALVKDSKKAIEAGAKYAGDDDLIEKIQSNKIKFDILVCESELMPKLSKFAKILGPKGLMPNEKDGTLTSAPVSAIKEFGKGKIVVKNDALANIHILIARVSWDKNKIKENLEYVKSEILKNKPTGIKKVYIKSASICTTMGPSIKLEF